MGVVLLDLQDVDPVSIQQVEGQWGWAGVCSIPTCRESQEGRMPWRSLQKEWVPQEPSSQTVMKGIEGSFLFGPLELVIYQLPEVRFQWALMKRRESRMFA